MASMSKIINGLRIAQREAWPPTLTFFKWGSELSTTPKETTVEKLQEFLKLNKADTKELVTGIQDAEIGKLIVGRRGRESRIQWLFTLPSVAKAARGLSDNLETVSLNKFPGVEKGGATDSYSEEDDAEHSYQLRAGRKITFHLPQDLTNKEAERLATFIKTLPYD